MGGGGGIGGFYKGLAKGSLGFTADVLDPIGVFHKGGGVLGDPLKVPKFPTPKKPPKPIEPDIASKQQHAKEMAIGAYGAADTMLTGGKGLGSAPAKNLWKSLGGA